MYVPEIIEVKDHLDLLKKNGLIADWELPYENLLTRRSAAIFFIDPIESAPEKVGQVWEQLSRYDNFSFRANEEQLLSKMKFRITFSAEEKEQNSKKYEELSEKMARPGK